MRGAILAVATLLLASSPSQARFLQTDPVGYADDLDMYTYVQNDPGNKADPTGLETPGISNWASSCENRGPCPEMPSVAGSDASYTGSLKIAPYVIDGTVMVMPETAPVLGPLKGAIEAATPADAAPTPRAAAREAMRRQNVPTSRPRSDVKAPGGRATPVSTRQQMATDSAGNPVVVSRHEPHEGGEQPHDELPHVHVAPAKIDPATGQPVQRPDGSVTYRNGGSVVPYEPEGIVPPVEE